MELLINKKRIAFVVLFFIILQAVFVVPSLAEEESIAYGPEQEVVTLEEYLDKGGEEWFLTGKKEYPVQAMMVSKETSFRNDLEAVDYQVTDDGETVIIKGTVDEMWTSKLPKVMSTYRKPDGSALSEEDFSEKDVYIDLVSIPDPDAYYAMYVPKTVSVTVETAWGNVLHTNLPNAEHGEGDFLVCRKNEEGGPDTTDVWVVNGAVFPNTYDTAHRDGAAASHEKDPSIAILFTNDVHCYYDRAIGYDGLVLYKKELEQQYEHVILVDVGDAAQGAPIGTISEGKELIRIMNEAGYDIAILGNHEFDYSMEVLDDLEEQLNCGYICANFCTSDGEPVYDPYKIIECGDTSVAFISVNTPDTFSKTKIHDLIDDQGVPMYDFKTDESGEPLYACLQGYIDEVKEKGVDYVILVAHLGFNDDATEAYRSNVVVSHLTGLDAVIDGHSHKVYNTTTKDAEGKEIPLVQAGCYFSLIGTVILHPDGKIDVDLIDTIPAPEDWMEGIEAETVTRNYEDRYVDAEMHQFLEDITASYAEIMNRKIGEVAFDMIVRDEDGEDISRNSENGLCELLADAFRELGGTDIGIVNAGVVRNNLPAGDITFNTIMDVLPYSGSVSIAEVKGQTILDALEFGYSSMPVIKGYFPQISGLECTIDLNIESSVELNEVGDFARVAGDRRVSNVLINGEPLDPEAVYTLTAPDFILTGGDHYSMFAKDATITESTQKTDSDMLVEYIEKNLNGVVPETYRQAGGRLHVIEKSTEE